MIIAHTTTTDNRGCAHRVVETEYLRGRELLSVNSEVTSDVDFGYSIK